VGPLSNWIKDQLPNFHQWQTLLVVPRQSPTTAQDVAERAKWNAEYDKRRKDAIAKNEQPPVEFPPQAPYAEWAKKIERDWQQMVADFKKVEGLTDEQLAAADGALYARRQQLADYLASEENSFADWQHELWRLGAWEAAPDAVDLPFQASRIQEKRAETSGASTGWIAQVRDLEAALQRDLRDVLTDEQEANPSFVDAANDALGDAKERRLHRLNVGVTCLIIGVGACLLLGLFTRLAALGGIVFLCMVIATQLPWEPGANTEFLYYQLIEIGALVVLLAAGAGRWAGLDFFLRALWARARSAPQTAPRG
jgi:uncharacterized membrane protein YphA (DoxX/SURF4 family)